MKNNSVNDFSDSVDKIISENIEQAISESNIREIFELIASDLNSNNPANISQEEFEKIAQISAAIGKGIAKHTVYATLESLHQINQLSAD